MKYCACIIVFVFAVYGGVAESSPLSIDVSLNTSTCNLTWRIKNNTKNTLEFSEGEMPWAEGVSGSVLHVYAGGILITQKDFSLIQYLRFVKIPPGSTISEKIPIMEMLWEWNLPEEDLTVRWKHIIERNTITMVNASGQFAVPKKCVVKSRNK